MTRLLFTPVATPPWVVNVRVWVTGAHEAGDSRARGHRALRPSDLAAWEGHVAMIVGNGMMIEARYQLIDAQFG